MKNALKTFLQAVLAGIAIGIGGAVYLTVSNKIVGSVLFTVGLYVIVLNGMFLYTGKIGYLLEQKPMKPYFPVLLLTWLGNFAGTWLTAKALSLTRFCAKLEEAAAACAAAKIGDSFVSLLILSVFCGLLVYAAVDGNKKKGNPLIMFVCVSVFILCGFEHCVANMFYISMAGMWSGKAILSVLTVTVGNSLGGLMIPAAEKLFSR